MMRSLAKVGCKQHPCVVQHLTTELTASSGAELTASSGAYRDMTHPAAPQDELQVQQVWRSWCLHAVILQQTIVPMQS